jgi:hypothetical protein
MNLHVREATPDDAKTIADFYLRMALGTEGRSFVPVLIVPGVRSALADAGKGRYRGRLEAPMFMNTTGEKGYSRPCIAM